MAIIYNGRNAKREKIIAARHRRRLRNRKWFAVFFAGLVTILYSCFYFNITLFYIALSICALPLFVTLILFISGVAQQSQIIEAIGDQGEQNALRILSYLDDTHTIFNNIDISYRDRVSQIDNILICNHGIFVIEVKNMKGHIKGHAEDKYLTQEKISRAGNVFSTDFYNPVRQVGTHVYQLSCLLNSHYISHYINGIVLFVNENALIEIESSDIPVFDINHINGLFDYINSNTPLLSKKEQRIVTEILFNHNLTDYFSIQKK